MPQSRYWQTLAELTPGWVHAARYHHTSSSILSADRHSKCLENTVSAKKIQVGIIQHVKKNDLYLLKAESINNVPCTREIMGTSCWGIKELREFGGTSLSPKLLYPPEVQTVGHMQTSLAAGGP